MNFNSMVKKKAKLYSLLYFTILFILSIVSLFINSYLSLSLLYVLVIYFAIKNDKNTLIFFLFFSLIQNIVLIIVAPYITSSVNTLFSLSKEVMIYACVVLSVLGIFIKQKAKINLSEFREYLIVFVLLGIILYSFIMSPAGNNAKVVAVRTICLPFVCLLFGYYVRVSYDDLRKIIIVISLLGVFISIFAFIDLFLFSDRLLTYLPLDRYYINKGTPNVFSWTGLPTNYTTWDFVAITGGISYRLISIFSEPLTFGHFSFGIAVLLDCVEWKYRRIVQLILFSASIFTLSKGIFLSLLVYIMFHFLCKISYKKARNTIILGFGVLVLFAFCGSSNLIEKLSSKLFASSSTMSHIRGLSSGFANASMFGKNLGKAGSVVYMLQDNSQNIPSVDVVENWMGGYVYQIGVLGLLCFIVFFGIHVTRLMKDYWTFKNKLSLATSILVICVLIESFFSDSSMSILGTGFYFIFSGIASRLVLNRKKASNWILSENNRI